MPSGEANDQKPKAKSQKPKAKSQKRLEQNPAWGKRKRPLRLPRLNLERGNVSWCNYFQDLLLDIQF